jgi:hypothetical protein
MIEDKATERLKERLKKLGLIVNMGADKPKPGTTPKVKAEISKAGKKGSNK